MTTPTLCCFITLTTPEIYDNYTDYCCLIALTTPEILTLRMVNVISETSGAYCNFSKPKLRFIPASPAFIMFRSIYGMLNQTIPAFQLILIIFFYNFFERQLILIILNVIDSTWL